MGSLRTSDKRTLVVEDFLPNLKQYLNEIYKIPLYEQKEFSNRFNLNATWPGKRSNVLNLECPFLYYIILQNLEKIFFLKKFTLNLHLHLRRDIDSEKDWIHKDLQDYSFLIYLNNTNLNSGTYLYNESNELISDIKYVQNRFVLFNCSYSHMGYGHFGTSPENGRLTINGFIKVEN
jgi:hypothetical protein